MELYIVMYYGDRDLEFHGIFDCHQAKEFLTEENRSKYDVYMIDNVTKLTDVEDLEY